jgi:putative membrane protein
MSGTTLSPLSIPYRVLQRGGSILIAAVFLLRGGTSLPVVGAIGFPAIAGILGLAVFSLVGYETAYVRRFRYDLTGNSLDIDSGVISRRNREIPLRRIQNVDISRNIIQRVLNIAVVSFETAGGNATEATLKFVSATEAKRLQQELSQRKQATSADADETQTVETPSSALLFEMNSQDLALLGIFSINLRVPSLLAAGLSTFGPAASTFLPVESPYQAFLPQSAGLAGPSWISFFISLLPVLLGVFFLSWVAGAASAITSYYDFSLRETESELRYERGMLQRYDGSIPFDKVQALTIEDGPLKRYFGYATLYVETAGYAPGQSSEGGRGSEVAIPLAKRDRIWSLAERIEPVNSVDIERPPTRARRRYAARVLIIIGSLTGALYILQQLVPLGVPWWTPLILSLPGLIFAQLLWSHRGHWIDDSYFVTRNGVFTRKTQIIPLYRIQTIIDTRNIFQRRLNLGTVIADTAGSRSFSGMDAAAVDIGSDRATELRESLESRLQSTILSYRQSNETNPSEPES